MAGGVASITRSARALRECARVLCPGSRLVLVDQFSWMLLPTMLTSRRGKVRQAPRQSAAVAGRVHPPHWHRLHAVIINAVTATKPA